MDPNTLATAIFAEQMAVLAARTFTKVRQLLDGSNTQSADQILADADSEYQLIIANAKAK